MAMKFIPLDGKKEPEFKEKYVVLFENNIWGDCWLAKIETLPEGKKYTFKDQADSHGKEIDAVATHFLKIELPKNNQ